MADEPYVHYYDSLTFEPDSMLVYRLVPIERADTLYDRLEMIIVSDSLSLRDTIQALDPPASDTLDLDDPDNVQVQKKEAPEYAIDTTVVERTVKRLPESDERKPKKLTDNMIWQQKE